MKFTSSSVPYYARDVRHGYPENDWLTEDGSQVRPLSMSFPQVLSVTQCQRLMKQALMQERGFQGEGTLDVSLAYLGLAVGDVFTITFDEMQWDSKQLQVTDTNLYIDNESNSLRYRINVRETDALIYSWSTVEELNVYANPAGSQTTYYPIAPTNLQLVSDSTTMIVNPDTSVTAGLKLTWDTPLDLLAVWVGIQYKLHTDGDDGWWTWPDVPIGHNAALITGGIRFGQNYDVRIRTVRSGGACSEWLEMDNFAIPYPGSFLGQLAAQYPGGVNLPQPGADKTSEQALAYTGASGNLVPNGDFLLGNMDGWKGGSSYDNTYRCINVPPNNGAGVFSPAFSVQPGNKYRLSWKGWANSSDPQQTYLRVCYSGIYSPNLSSNISGYQDFVGSGSIAVNDTNATYTYDWTAPADARYAVLAMYSLANPGLAFTHVVAQDYGAANEWGADKTGNNTSNNTNNVGSIDSGSVSSTINPGGGIDFNHPGNTHQGQLSKIDLANTANIVAGAVNASVSYGSTSAVSVPTSTDATLASVTIDSSGGFVVLTGLIAISSGNLGLYLYKGSTQLSSVIVVGNFISDVYVDTSPDPSQPYELHAVNVSPVTNASVNRVRLVADHKKV